jgi:hypothetical protein
MEIEKMTDNDSYEQIILANAVEDFLTKLLIDYPEEYYVEISIGNDDSGKMIIPITKTFRGSKKLIE